MSKEIVYVLPVEKFEITTFSISPNPVLTIKSVFLNSL